MIFQGPGNLPLIRASLDEEILLENWQLNRGDFSRLEAGNRVFSRLSAQRAVLHYALWENCSLNQAEFSQCSLEGAVFRQCDLEEPRLVSCQLRETRWEGISLTGGLMRGCSGPRLHWEGSALRRFTLAEPEISRARFIRITAVSSLFTATHESGVTGIGKSFFKDCLFIGCRFEGRIFSECRLENCLFIGCRFIDADRTGMERENCRFADCIGLTRKPGEEVFYGRDSGGGFGTFRNIDDLIALAMKEK